MCIIRHSKVNAPGIQDFPPKIDLDTLWVCMFLILFIHLSYSTISATKTGHVSVRQASGNPGPVHPVDCVASEWSQWSRCDVCQKKKV